MVFNILTSNHHFLSRIGGYEACGVEAFYMEVEVRNLKVWIGGRAEFRQEPLTMVALSKLVKRGGGGRSKRRV